MGKEIFYNYSYDEYEQEDLQRWTSGRGFRKEDMDMRYEHDVSNYPDGKNFISKK
jgi:hypothetical protein